MRRSGKFHRLRSTTSTQPRYTQRYAVLDLDVEVSKEIAQWLCEIGTTGTLNETPDISLETKPEHSIGNRVQVYPTRLARSTLRLIVHRGGRSTDKTAASTRHSQ